METCHFRQLEEKYVGVPLDKLVWSPKVDLLAVANEKGEVVLRRLSWQKVWAFESPEGLEGYLVNCMAWRPDGKALAIAFGKDSSNDGKLVLVDIEDGEILHIHDVVDRTMSLSWVEETHGTEWSGNDPLAGGQKEKASVSFRPKLPPLSKSYGSVSKRLDEDIEDQQKIQEQTKSTLLLAGTQTGFVYMYMYGVYQIGICELPDFLGTISYPLSVNLTEDLNYLSIVSATSVSGEEMSNLVATLIDTSMLTKYSCELQVLAKKYGQVISIVTYMTHTLEAIKAAWESILTEMDTKLATYAEKIGSNGSVAADFLELLMFGMTTPELEHFLARDLTEKGLKKMGHVIEVSYTNVQKLILKHMENAGHALVCHLTDILGFARQEKFRKLNINESDVHAALQATACFLCKALEVQQVIDKSAKNFKAFYRWLYIAVLRLNNEQISSELSKITQQDIVFTAEFIKSFDTVTTGVVPDRKKFHLERVGQYLEMADLAIPLAAEECPWSQFLDDNPTLKKYPFIFKPERMKSLCQLHKSLEESVAMIFKRPQSVIKDTLRMLHHVECFKVGDMRDLKISQIHNHAENKLFVTGLTQAPPAKTLHITEISLSSEFMTRGAQFNFENVYTQLANCDSNINMIMDVQVYNKNVLSVLLGSLEQYVSRNSLFIQFQWQAACDRLVALSRTANDLKNYPVVQSEEYVEPQHVQLLESFPGICFAVSGERKVAVVVFHNRTLVRLFETEAEDEDYEDEDMDSTILSAKGKDSSVGVVEKMESIDDDGSGDSFCNDE